MIEQVVVVAGGSPEIWPDMTEYQSENLVWIGVDRGSYYLIQRNIIPDIAVGDFDSLSREELKEVEQVVSDIHYSIPEKDETDTQLAIQLALQRFPEARIHLIGATGGRIDHFLANFWMPLEPRFKKELEKFTMKDNQNTITYFSPGHYELFKEKDKKYLAYVCLTPVSNLSLVKVKYPLTDYQVEYPMSFASNEFIGETCNFSFETGVIAVIQSKDI